jgi:endonuclease YncB( thermonuclease family)
MTVAALVSSLLVVAPAAVEAAETLRQRGRIVKVVDGDTVDVRLVDGRERRVRLIGIDTPEVHGVVQCGGPRASRSLKRLLPLGTRVRLVSDPTQDLRDRYGRLLRYVIKVSTSRDVNEAQVFRGWASVYVYDNNPFRRIAQYRRAQRQAKTNLRGIWGLC